MIRIRRALVAGLVPLALVGPVVPAGARPDVSSASAGSLAYITASGVLDVVNVNSDGSTSAPTQLGPVTTVQPPKTVKVAAMVVSGDGTRLAWSEVISKTDPQYGELQTDGELVVRNMVTGHVITVHSEDYPLGFAGHTLVVVGAHTRRLAMSPTPHLVTVHDGGAYAVAAYAKGIVDVSSSVGGSDGTVERDRLRLASFGGHHTLLHAYKVGMSYRSAAANIDAVSPDGKKLVVERGNHQDFEGLGPSSLFDTFSLGRHHVRHALGHYGSNKAKWRLQGATFAGPNDTVWLALHSGYVKTASGYAVRGIVVRYVAGHWQKESSSAIAVAGNSAGWVVIQGGAWAAVPNSPDGEYAPSPTFPALLEGPHGFHHTLADIRASQLLWIG